jgi:hypothetical protein
MNKFSEFYMTYEIGKAAKKPQSATLGLMCFYDIDDARKFMDRFSEGRSIALLEVDGIGQSNSIEYILASLDVDSRLRMFHRSSDTNGVLHWRMPYPLCDHIAKPPRGTVAYDEIRPVKEIERHELKGESDDL